jgi:hypothetical protein
MAEPDVKAADNANNDTDFVFRPGSFIYLIISLCSYIFKYPEKNKRTYYVYKANKYLFLNNNKERDCLDL